MMLVNPVAQETFVNLQVAKKETLAGSIVLFELRNPNG